MATLAEVGPANPLTGKGGPYRMIWLVIIVYKKVKQINWLFAPSTNFWIWLVGNVKQPIVDKLVK